MVVGPPPASRRSGARFQLRWSARIAQNEVEELFSTMPSAEQTDFGPYAYVRDWDNLRSAKGWWHSFELPGGRRIDGAVDLAALKLRLAQFPIPADLRGKRVLDIGAWDGWYSFEMERRGAEVMAIDCWDNPRFHEVHEIL
jgi:2-polyprenyl-3-methyl-5-hydroxy-6-metoxy-1,4-benzoquinol methylase